MAPVFARPLASLVAITTVLSKPHEASADMPEVLMAKQPRTHPRKLPPVIQDAVKKSDYEKDEDINSDRDHHGVVLKLNSHIFHGNVLRKNDDRVAHWVVYYCPAWYDHCQSLAETSYASAAAAWQKIQNEGSMMSLPVRFARVDCATDKPLCNEMGVEDYPTVQHFHMGEKVSVWVGQSKNLAASLDEYLNDQLGRIGVPPPAAKEDSMAKYVVPGDRALDVMVILLVLALNLWAVTSNPDLWQKAQAPLKMLKPAAPAVAPPAAPAPVAAPVEEMPQQKGIERLLPDEWLQQRRSVAMEL